MTRTRLGELLLAVGWAAMVVSLLLRALPLALFGVMLVAFVLSARVAPGRVTVARDVPARVVEREPFVVRTTAHGPPEAPLFLSDDAPPGTRVHAQESKPQRGSAELVTTMSAEGPGSLAWWWARVRVEDRYGLAQRALVLPVASIVRSEPSSVVAGRARPFGATVAQRRGLASGQENEIERLREHRPGDRLRDIDWAHSSRLGQLIAREFTRPAVMPLVVMLGLGASMRRERRVRKASTAIHLAVGLLAAGAAHGRPRGLVAWSERGIETEVRLTTQREILADAARRLGELPPAGSEIAHPARDDLLFQPSPADRAFLSAVATFGGGSGATPLEDALAALGRVTRLPAIVALVLDVEESPAALDPLLRRLRAKGHSVVVLAVATGPHTHTLRTVDRDALHDLIAWRTNRQLARGICDRQGVPFHVFGPAVERRDMEEVLRSAA